MKTILITGANKGIGFATAKQLAQLGYYVYLGSRNRNKGIKAVDRLKSEGLTNVGTIQLDVPDKNSIKKAKQELEAKTEALDVLINNTGRTTTDIIISRIEKEAKILLKQTDWTVSEIAFCLGFEEVAHFSNFFKKQADMAPSAFRS